MEKKKEKSWSHLFSTTQKSNMSRAKRNGKINTATEDLGAD